MQILNLRMDDVFGSASGFLYKINTNANLSLFIQKITSQVHLYNYFPHTRCRFSFAIRTYCFQWEMLNALMIVTIPSTTQRFYVTFSTQANSDIRLGECCGSLHTANCSLPEQIVRYEWNYRAAVAANLEACCHRTRLDTIIYTGSILMTIVWYSVSV